MMFILCFLYIFAFPLGTIPVVDSSWIAFFISLFALLFDGRYREKFRTIISIKKIYRIGFMILVICLYGWVVTTLSGANDYSFIVTMLHQLFSLVVGVFVVTFIYSRGKNILDCVIWSFFVQSCFQMVSMFSNSFRIMTNLFRPRSAITIGQWSYTGIRGLAISGYAFFGLAVAYGLVFILWSLYYDKVLKNIPIPIKVLMLGMMIFGGMSAGRTSLIGLAIAAVIFVLSKTAIDVRRVKIKTFIAVCASLIIVFCGVLVAIQSGVLETEQVKHLTNYVSEFSRTGTTTSGTELFKEMYFHIKPETVFFGDGIYETATGYYMNTDAGYMRPILFFGIPGLLLLFGLQMLYFQNKYYLSRKNKYIIFAFLLIMQIKGEIVGFSIIIEAIMLLFFFTLCLTPDRNDNKGVSQ